MVTKRSSRHFLNRKKISKPEPTKQNLLEQKSAMISLRKKNKQKTTSQLLPPWNNKHLWISIHNTSRTDWSKSTLTLDMTYETKRYCFLLNMKTSRGQVMNTSVDQTNLIVLLCVYVCFLVISLIWSTQLRWICSRRQKHGTIYPCGKKWFYGNKG